MYTKKLTKQHPLSPWPGTIEKYFSEIRVRFLVHTGASAIDFRQNCGYYEHLNSKKNAPRILTWFTTGKQIEIQDPVIHTRPKRSQTRIRGLVLLDAAFSHHALRGRLPSLSPREASLVFSKQAFWKAIWSHHSLLKTPSKLPMPSGSSLNFTGLTRSAWFQFLRVKCASPPNLHTCSNLGLHLLFSQLISTHFRLSWESAFQGGLFWPLHEVPLLRHPEHPVIPILLTW